MRPLTAGNIADVTFQMCELHQIRYDRQVNGIPGPILKTWVGRSKQIQ